MYVHVNLHTIGHMYMYSYMHYYIHTGESMYIYTTILVTPVVGLHVLQMEVYHMFNGYGIPVSEHRSVEIIKQFHGL